SALTMTMNPTTLKRVYDNEFRIPAEQDALTLPELFDSLTNAIWTEFKNGAPTGSFTARKPAGSSLRRNRQREYVDRLIARALPGRVSGAAAKPVSNLAQAQLRSILAWAKNTNGSLDAYSKAHVEEIARRIDKALDAQYIYNQPSGPSLPP